MSPIVNAIFALFVVQGIGVRELLRLPLANGLVVALAFLVLHGLFRGFFRKRRIQHASWDLTILVHELFFSFTTLALGGVVGMATIYLLQRGIATIDWDHRTVLTVLRQVILYLLLFDLYFYAVHRLLHLRPLYAWVHKVHHRSTTPNPLTAFSVHPVEALLGGSFLPLALILFPFHVYTVVIVSIYGTLNSVLLHAGHEVFPSWWYRNRLSRWFVTPSFHDAHHSEGTGNYGTHTTLWDRVFRTIQPRFALQAGGARAEARRLRLSQAAGQCSASPST